MLEGELTVTAAEGELTARAGTWVQVPAAVPHAVAVAGSGPARFLDVHTPGCRFGGFVRALHSRSTAEQAAARASFDQIPE